MEQANSREYIRRLSYCGLYCCGCKNYKENAGCRGCRYEEALVDDCPLRACAIEKGLLHCGDCSDFSCEMLAGFYAEQNPNRALAKSNMRRLREIGEEGFCKEQEGKHTCSCGGKIYWFESSCNNENHKMKGRLSGKGITK